MCVCVLLFYVNNNMHTNILIVNGITTTGKSGKHLRVTYASTGQSIRAHQHCIP